MGQGHLVRLGMARKLPKRSLEHLGMGGFFRSIQFFFAGVEFVVPAFERQ